MNDAVNEELNDTNTMCFCRDTFRVSYALRLLRDRLGVTTSQLLFDK